MFKGVWEHVESQFILYGIAYFSIDKLSKYNSIEVYNICEYVIKKWIGNCMLSWLVTFDFIWQTWNMYSYLSDCIKI